MPPFSPPISSASATTQPELTRVPPWFRHTISRRGVWNLCTLEQSCFGPMHDPTPSAPFHHFGVRLDHGPLKMGWILDGVRTDTDLPWDHVSVIPAGASMKGWWDRPVDFACLYFTPAALMAAAGEEMLTSAKSEIRPAVGVQSPTLCNLVRALHDDAAHGHPYGKMLGESIFVSMAALVVNDGRILHDSAYREGIGDRRVRRALEFIHAHIDAEMDVCAIAQAAETSPFHLSRSFRNAMGCSIWQYVSRRRVQLAAGLMKDPALTLAEVASMSGFESYSTFATSFKASRGVSPARFRVGL
jgi:AraC family transcriptional regulator